MKSKDIVKCINQNATKAPFFGQLAEVKFVYSDGVLILEDYMGEAYDTKDFIVYREYDEVQDIPVGTPLDIYNAFSVIKQWNERHTQAMNIGIDSGDPREGGTLFIIGERFDSHDPMESMRYLLDYCVQLRDKETLDLCEEVLNARRRLMK